MKENNIKQRLKRDLRKDGLILLTTSETSRDFWQVGRHSVIDSSRLLIASDIDVAELAWERGLLPNT
jgi:hypothetical protein